MSNDIKTLSERIKPNAWLTPGETGNILAASMQEAAELRARILADEKLIAEQNQLAQERQEWALHTNQVIRELRAALALAQAPSAPVAPDERAAFETEISKLSDRVDFERYTEQKAARNNHSFPAPQFKPVEIGDYVLSSVQSGWLMWQARAALSVKAEQRAAVHRRVLQNSVDGPDVVGPTVCDLPPSGWYCTRAPGHDGPCAAYPAEAPTPPTTGEA